MGKTLDKSVEEEFYRRFTSHEIKGMLEPCNVPLEVSVRYDGGLNAFSIAHLFYRGITPEKANSFLSIVREVDADYKPPWEDLLWFATARLSREQVLRYTERELEKIKALKKGIDGYSPRFSEEERVELQQAAIPPSIANAYDGSLSALGVKLYFKKRLYPEQVQRYYPELRDISFFLMLQGVSAEQARLEIQKYDNRFNFLDKKMLLQFGVNAETANSFGGKFSAIDIIGFFGVGITAHLADAYDTRFSAWGIQNLVKGKVYPHLANAYPDAISGDDIAELVSMSVSAEQAAAYPQNVQRAGIKYVIKAGISPERSLLHNPVFTGYHIKIFETNNFQPGTANKWAEYARSKKPFINLADDIIELEMYGLPPNVAMRYDDRIARKNKIMLWKKGIAPEEAMYPSRFGFYSLGSYYDDPFDEVNGFIERGICPDIAAKFGQIFSGVDIIRFLDGGLSAEQANAYSPCKNPWLVKKFIDGGILPEHASFIPGISSWLALMGVTSVELPAEEQHKKILLLNEMSLFWGRADSQSFAYIGYGTQAILLLSENNTAFRFSEDIQREYALLQRVNQYHEGRQKNVLRVLSEPQRGIAVEVEYIDGPSLEQILYGKQRSLPYSEVLDYGAGILNGIRELREAGIFHRDINPWNVMISKDGKPIVIDLGVATANPDELYPGNRAFGGNNDLISLGLLMYRMATGNALFNDGHPEHTRDNEAKDAIKAAREKAYDNGRVGLGPYLDKVRQDVKYPKLSGMIVTLLDDDLWKQPTLQRVYDMQKVFNAA